MVGCSPGLDRLVAQEHGAGCDVDTEDRPVPPVACPATDHAVTAQNTPDSMQGGRQL